MTINLLVPLALLSCLLAVGRAELGLTVAGDTARAGAVHLRGHVEEHGTHLSRVGRDAVLLGKLVVGLLALRGDHAATVATVDAFNGLVHMSLSGVGKDAHNHCAGTVGALVLAEVVRARELLAAVGALKGLVVGVERAVVTLQVFLTTEATRAESADEGLGRVVSQRLLAATAGGVAVLRRSASSGLGALRVIMSRDRNLSSVLGGLGGLVEVGRSIALLAALALRLHDGSSRVLRDGVLGGSGREAATGKLLITEALLAEEAIVLDKARGHVETLTLVAVEVDALVVVGSEAGEVVLNVKLKGKLKGRKTTKVGELSLVGNDGMGVGVHGDVSLKHAVVLLAGAESREGGEFDVANSEVPGVADFILGSDRPGNGRRRRGDGLGVAGGQVVRAIDGVGARLEEDWSHRGRASPVTASEDLGEYLLLAAFLDGGETSHHRVVEESTVDGGRDHAARRRAVNGAEAAGGRESRGSREVGVAAGVEGHHHGGILLEHDGGLVVVGARRGVRCQHGVRDVSGLLSVLHLRASRVRTLLIDWLLVHHVFRAGLNSGGGHVTVLRWELDVLVLAVVGVVVELLAHWGCCVRCVFHFVISVCYLSSASIVAGQVAKGSTDVVVLVNQVRRARPK